MRQKLNLVTLGVKNFNKSLKFYENLGWNKSSASMDDMALFHLGGMVLSLYPKDKLAEDANINNEGSGFSGITLALNSKSEKEVEDILREAEKSGGKIIKHAQKAFWGGYHGYFADPDGYLFEIAYNPFWDLDENDDIKLP